MNEKINIVIPTYNEDKNILSLLKKIKLYIPNAKICIVDDSKENKIKHILKKNKLHSVLYFHRKNSKGRGSAIFIHQWRREGYPTEGCIALSKENLLRVAKFIDFGSKLIIPETLHAHQRWPTQHGYGLPQN